VVSEITVQMMRSGMLNDYQKFGYRIKCSISFSFVSHSILELLIFRGNDGERWQTALLNTDIQYWVTPSVAWQVQWPGLLPSTPPARSCERRGSGGCQLWDIISWDRGWRRLPAELPRCVGRVTETVIVVDTCLDHCLRRQVSPPPAVSQQTFRDVRMLKFWVRIHLHIRI